MGFEQLVQWFGVPLAVVVFLIITGAREKPMWVFGWQYRETKSALEKRVVELEATCDKWEVMALKSFSMVEKVEAKNKR